MQQAVSPKKKDAVQRNTPAPRPHQGLTKTQEELAELAADMLLNGGGAPEVTMLLRALDQHHYRRFITNLYKSKTGVEVQKELDDRNAKYGSNIDPWYRQLLTEWPKRQPVERESSIDNKAPQAVKDIARAGVKEQLQHAFDQFLNHEDGVEPHWLLNEILEYTTGAGYDLAEAFTVVFDTDDTYVRVPWNFRNKVKEFVALLDKKAA